MAEQYIKMKTEANKKRRKKRTFIQILTLFIVLISVLTTLCLKLTYFNIRTIEVVGNKNVSAEDIIKNSKIEQGNNIFYIDLRESRTNLLKNNNIMDINIKRVFPSKIVIAVKEREAVFYTQRDNKYLIIDKEGIVIEEKDKIDNLKLVRLDGIDLKNVSIGKTIPVADNRALVLIGKITELCSNNISKYSFTSVNLSSLLNVNMYCGNICIKIGTADDIENKLNKALNIIDSQGLGDKKGYVDVSYDGNPVFHIDK